MLSSECNITLMSKKYMYPKILLLLKFLFCVCISLCNDEIGLSSSKGNAITFCYIPEINEFLVKIKGVT